MEKSGVEELARDQSEPLVGGENGNAPLEIAPLETGAELLRHHRPGAKEGHQLDGR